MKKIYKLVNAMNKNVQSIKIGRTELLIIKAKVYDKIIDKLLEIGKGDEE